MFGAVTQDYGVLLSELESLHATDEYGERVLQNMFSFLEHSAAGCCVNIWVVVGIGLMRWCRILRWKESMSGGIAVC